VQADDNSNLTFYAYLDMDCTEPDLSTPPGDFGWTEGCDGFGSLGQLDVGWPRHPYNNVFKYYSFANCTGTPEIFWFNHTMQNVPPFCFAARDPDYPSSNVPFFMDCKAGTYTVYETIDAYSICHFDDMQNVLAAGSLQAFRYYDKCLSDYEYPLTPHVKVSCGGYEL
jgi:hypothetical protein